MSDDELEPRHRSRRRGRPVVTVLVILVVLFAAGAVYLGVRVEQQAALVDARTAALDAGQGYAVALSTYDYRNLDAGFDTINRDSTSEFAGNYAVISQNIRPALLTAKSKATATVLAAGVQSASTDRVVLVLFVDQSVTNASNPDPQVTHDRMELTLAKVDGTWKIDGVQLR